MKKCVLVIGHKESSPGAVNKRSGVSEFQFNDILSEDIEEALRTSEVEVIRVYRTVTYQKLPALVNELHPDFIISLHCNAVDEMSSGTEVLYYHRSQTGRRIALVLLKALTNALGLPNRGVKARDSEGRGGSLLRYTAAPCIIAEPFFIDNDFDYERAVHEKRMELVMAYSTAIEEIAAML